MGVAVSCQGQHPTNKLMYSPDGTEQHLACLGNMNMDLQSVLSPYSSGKEDEERGTTRVHVMANRLMTETLCFQLTLNLVAGGL